MAGDTAPALVAGAGGATAAAIVRRLSAAGRDVAVLGADVDGAALSLPVGLAPDAVVAAVERELGGLGALVCAVPVPEPAGFLERGPLAWSSEVAGVLTPVFGLVRAAVPALRRAGTGRVVLLGAGWTPSGQPRASAAAAAHGGVVAMVKTLARDLGASGTTVNEVVSDVSQPPLPEAVARAVDYLCGPDAGAVVGQLLTVGRGGSLRP